MIRKSTLLKHVLALIVAVLITQLAFTQAITYRNGMGQGVIRIKFKPVIMQQVKELSSKSGKPIVSGISSLDGVFKAYSVTEMKRVFPVSPKFEERHIKHGLNQWYEVYYSSAAEIESIVAAYKHIDIIETAEPIYEKSIGEGKPVYINSVVKSTKDMPFNDPYLPKQWNYDNTGQSGGTPDADINLFQAWNVNHGKPNVIVSIHDMGVESSHEDLHDHMWVNQAELNGQDRVDDDGNGYKDDVYGFNFADNIGEITPGFHATHVAGTIGAVNNNGIGVCGIAGGTGSSDGVRMMSCQILGGVSQGNTPESYAYAADNGAVISQNSWGYTNPYAYEQSVLDGIDYFIKEAGNYAGSPMKGGVVIFAAGNSNTDGEWYPGYYPNTISVAALDASNNKASYSNFGTWVDIAAPGGDAEDDQIGQTFDNNSILSTLTNNRYGYLDGTSMACPHVSGVAALIVSQFGGTNFTNEDLKTHLLTAFKNIYDVAGNMDYLGKLGKGAVDAALALAKDNKIAPRAVTDLTVASVSQDFIDINWSVPSDEDDGKPTSFQVLYSTEPINLANLKFAKTVTLENTLPLGATQSFEMSGLESFTKYYLSVRSYDRWGNLSAFSNEATATTNSGPDASIDEATSSISIAIDASINAMGSSEFNLMNTGEGLLRWNAETRHVNYQSAFNKSLNFPLSKKTADLSKINLKSQLLPKTFTSTKFIHKPQWDEMYYYDPEAGGYIIGETDIELTNSSATRFYVEKEEGFNLNAIQALLNFLPGKGSAILEIYRGEDIRDAKIVYSQDIPDCSYPYWNYITLNEEVYFPQGTTFWIVFHVPSGNLYPLGAGVEVNKEDSKNCYISLDLGKSWQMLEDLYYNNLMVWAVTAISNYSYPGEYIQMSPVSGELSTGDVDTIAASVDATEMANGTYTANLVINTNDTKNPMLRVPATIEITGHKPVIKSASIVEFGSVLIGNSKTVQVTLQNTGYAKFNYPQVSVSNPSFISLAEWGLPTIEPQEEITTSFKFTPTLAGNNNATVTLTTDDGNNYTFNLFGVGAEPPVIELTPDSSVFTNVSLGDTLHGNLTIKNIGKYPLNYYFPRFASGENVGELTAETQKFGYITRTNEGGVNPSPAYVWNDISSTGTEVTEFFKNSSNGNFKPVDLDFDFPFFGIREHLVYLTGRGLLSFDQNSTFNSMPLKFKDQYSPDRFITALGYDFDFSKGGRIFYKQDADEFIIQYENMVYDSWNNPPSNLLSFQIVLHDNGNINIYYKSLGGLVSSDLDYFYAGIEDQNQDDGIVLHDYFHPYMNLLDETAVEFINPGLGLLQSVSPAYGTVQVGESRQVEFSLATSELYVGNFTENLPILSNDPNHNPAVFPVGIHVTHGGTASMHVSDTLIDFGKVFLTDTKKMTLNVFNSGKAISMITAAAFDHDYFTLSGVIPATVKPARNFAYEISIHTATLGNYTDVLRITTNTGDIFNIHVKGEVVPPPVIMGDISSINDTLAYGAKKTHQLTISNPGENTLEFAFEGPEWLTIAKKTIESRNIPEFTYFYKLSDDAEGPAYSWTEIAQVENKVNGVKNWPDSFYRAVKLPFTFNFYGITYDTVYIGASGLLTFNKNQEVPFWGSGQPLPSTESPNNLICPLFGGSYAATWYMPDAGYYMKAGEDQVIFEWYMFEDMFGMGSPISYQAILYKNGNIKFQYNYDGIAYSQIPNLAVVGVENADGTDGVQIAYRQGIVKDQLAILINPVAKQTLEAGSSQSFDLFVDAGKLYAGSYNSKLSIYNNTPGNGILEIPANLIITGNADLQYPDSIGFGQVMIRETTDDYGWTIQQSYEQEFEIKNTGTASATVNAFQLMPKTESRIDAWLLTEGWFGDYYWDWNNVEYLWEPVVIKPHTSLKLRATVTPTGAFSEISDTLILTTDMPEETIRIGVFATPVFPPVVGTDPEEINIYANTPGVTKDTSFYIENLLGASNLDYTMAISYTRKSETASTAKSVMAAASKGGLEPLLQKKISANPLMQKGAKAYNRVLEYDQDAKPNKSLGYGGSMPMSVATKFVAPADGFNLTHVKTWYVPGEWLNSNIEIKILGGATTIEKAQEMLKQTYNYKISEGDGTGSYLEIKLDTNIIFYPNEVFFVVFGYPTGAEYPQGVASVPANVHNRFFFSTDEETWYDLTLNGFAGDGWMIKAMEETAASKEWVKVLSPMSGTVAPGEKVKIDVHFDAHYTETGRNEASVIIQNNDPVTPEKSMPLNILRNEGPRFDLGKEASYSVRENDTLVVDILASDFEDDAFTVKMAATYPHLSSSIAGGTIHLVYTPDYLSQGDHTFSITGTDTRGNISKFALHVNVININRSPLLAGTFTQLDFTMTDLSMIKLANIIYDPDEEALDYSLSTDNEDILKIYIADDAIIVEPRSEGTTLFTLTGTDPEGLSASISVPAVVHPLGVTSIESHGPILYPNPASSFVVFSGANESQVEVFDAKGVLRKTINTTSEKQEVGVSDLENGVYLVRITSGNTSQVKQLTIIR